MLKDVFSNRLFIGALAFFVLCVCGSLLYMQHVKEQTAKALAESDDFQQWWHERNAKEKAVASEVATSDDAADASHPEVSVGDSVVGAAKTDEPETDNTPDFALLSPEHQQRILDQFYHQRGLNPPPKGSEYVWKDIGVVLLDEKGDPVLHKKGEPYVTIKYGIGFAPTREEYERYEQLQEDQGWAASRGDVTEVERLTAEIEALETSVQRMRPISRMSLSIGAEASAKADAAMDAKYNAALREYGLEHLISPY
jgi:hypothetical protein